MSKQYRLALLEEMMIKKSDIKALEARIQEIQLELLDEGIEDLEREGCKITRQRNSTYYFNKAKAEEFERFFPDLVVKKYLTTGLSEDVKRDFFERKLSKEYISVKPI